MNILVLTEGGRKFGFGHLTRCLALSQGFGELLKAHFIKYKIEFIVHGDKTAENIFRRNEKITLKDWGKGISNLRKKISASDLVIMDSYSFPRSIYDRVYKLLIETEADCQRPKLICIDDNNRIDYPPSVIVNPSLGGEKLKYQKGTQDKKVFLLGKKFVILRKEFWRFSEKIINKRIREVLVVFSGKEFNGLERKVINFLTSEFPGLQFHLVSPKKSLFAESKNVKIHSDINAGKILKLMLKCDICISGGGQVLYELAKTGVPTVTIVFAKNQIRQVREFEKASFLDNLGFYNRKNILAGLKKAIKDLKAYKIRKKRHLAGVNLIDAGGAARIARCWFEGFQGEEEDAINLREVSLGDCRDIWKWRNHPLVRRWSFNNKRISYKDHREWFKKKIHDKYAEIYIAQNSKGEKIGQARFECTQGRLAHINVNLNPAFFSNGLGNKIIRSATLRFFSDRPEVKNVIAEIKEDNIVSKKSFRKAGYKFSHLDCRKKNKSVCIFKFSKI